MPPLAHTFRRAILPLLAALMGLLLTAPARAEQTHTVARGHTLGKIARRYHTTVEALRKANGLRPRDKLHPGQKLVIPGLEPSPKPAKAISKHKPDSSSKRRPSSKKNGPHTTHQVAKGHTLGKIARRYRTTVEALLEANGLSRRDRLKLGQCLIVPLDHPTSGRRPCEVDGTKPAGKGKSAGKGKGRGKSYASKPRRRGVIHIVRGGASWSGRPLTPGGRPRKKALKELDQLIRGGYSAKIRTDRRLIRLLVKVSDHFGGRPIHIVSGYRPESTNRFSMQSKHNHGQAVDFRVEGVPNKAVRTYCQKFRGTGVGYYPNSSFVHLDVRSVTTHWVDLSGPGERPRYLSVTSPDPPKKRK